MCPIEEFSAAPPTWIQLYQAALFEIDKDRLPTLIKDAERAILCRKQELYDTVPGAEYRSLCGAQIVLKHLSRIYGVDANRSSAA